jgi:FkbM family methyltransferase
LHQKYKGNIMTSYPSGRRLYNDVDGIDNWFWPVYEKGMFAVISNDWVTSHADKYFKYMMKNDVCIQAGGACGMYAKLLSRQFKTVYTFEPYHDSFYYLARNCYESNIVKFNAALGSAPGLISVDLPFTKNQGETAVSKTVSGNIPTLVIDNLGLTACDFIQLDIEGSELEALKGAIETIKLYQPVIACELSTVNKEEITKFMTSIDYTLVDMSVMDGIFLHNSRVTK